MTSPSTAKSLLQRFHERPFVRRVVAFAILIATVLGGIATFVEHYHTLAQLVGVEREKGKTSTPSKDRTTLVAVLKVRAGDDLVDMQNVIDVLATKQVDGKPVDVSRLRELKAHFEILHARYIQAIADDQNVLAHETNDEIQQLLVDFRTETNSLVGGIGAAMFAGLRFRYVFEPAPEQDRQYDEARAALQELNASTVDVTTKIQFPGPTPDASTPAESKPQ
jgi:hypothetical protein